MLPPSVLCALHCFLFLFVLQRVKRREVQQLSISQLSPESADRHPSIRRLGRTRNKSTCPASVVFCVVNIYAVICNAEQEQLKIV